MFITKCHSSLAFSRSLLELDLEIEYLMKIRVLLIFNGDFTEKF